VTPGQVAWRGIDAILGLRGFHSEFGVRRRHLVGQQMRGQKIPVPPPSRKNACLQRGQIVTFTFLPSRFRNSKYRRRYRKTVPTVEELRLNIA
jgi:hypothetical protein